MAHVVPDLPFVSGPGQRAEHELVEALRHGLDEAWFVFPRFSFVEASRAAEGEADVLLLHREHGLLAIECKGRGVRRSEGKWVRELEDGSAQVLRESPFEQAQRTVKGLVRTLEARLREAMPELDALPFVHGHAVAFPRASSLEALPAEGAREIVLLAEDLRDVEGWALRALAFWARARRRPTPLEPAAFKRFRKQVLFPSVRLVPSLASSLDAEQAVFARLSEEQVAAVDAFGDNPRIAVVGPAGSGKSLVALELARRAAAEGRRVLLTCFTKALAWRLKHEVRELADLSPGAIDVAHFHSLCRQAGDALGRPLAVPPPERAEEVARFWSEDAPLVLAEAAGAGRLGPWQAVVVDEAQDFEPLWWMVLEDALAKVPGARLAMLHDPAQLLFGRTSAVPAAPTFRLTRNFRNTRAIAEAARALHPGAAPPSPLAPEGEPPSVLHAKNPTRVRDALEELVARLVLRERISPERIVVLTPHSRRRSSVAEVTRVAGLPLVEHRQPLEPGSLAHATISAFKGLEADVVVLLDLDPEDPRSSREARYVAATRARHRLYVIGATDWTR